MEQSNYISKVGETKILRKGISLWKYKDGKVSKITDEDYKQTSETKRGGKKRILVVEHGAMYDKALNKKNALRKFNKRIEERKKQITYILSRDWNWDVAYVDEKKFVLDSLASDYYSYFETNFDEICRVMGYEVPFEIQELEGEKKDDEDAEKVSGTFKKFEPGAHREVVEKEFDPSYLPVFLEKGGVFVMRKTLNKQ